jgi:hypothetical protein
MDCFVAAKLLLAMTYVPIARHCERTYVSMAIQKIIKTNIDCFIATKVTSIRDKNKPFKEWIIVMY